MAFKEYNLIAQQVAIEQHRLAKTLRSNPLEKGTSNYSDESFWQKIKDFALAAGKDVIEKALWLFYTVQRKDCPSWAQAVIYSALGYFILHVDAIPDFLPVVGYSDDLGALAAALASVSSFTKDKQKEQAKEKLQEWFD